MKLLGKRVIIREIEDKKEKHSGIIVQNQQNPFITGKVVAVGTECDVPDLKIGATVMVNRFIGGQVEWEGETLHMYLPEEIIAIS